MSKTITRLFDNYSDATNAINALERLGVPRDDLSIMANERDSADGGAQTDTEHTNDGDDLVRGASTGAALGGAGGLLAGLGLLTIPGLGPIVAAGWIASAAFGAGLGFLGGAATGTIVGALKDAGHSEEEAHVYSEGMRRGGTLVSARVDDALVGEVEELFRHNNAVDAQSRGSAYRQSGWSEYEHNAPLYTDDEVAAERSRYGSSVPVN
jgi:hypothetical protein